MGETHSLGNKLSDSKSRSGNIVRPLPFIMHKHVDWPNVSVNRLLAGIAQSGNETHGSRRIIGCPFSPFSTQNFSPRGIINSTNRAKTAFSADLTILAFT